MKEDGYLPSLDTTVAMSVGTILLAICLWDHLSRLLITNKSEIKSDIVK